jgi:flagellar hook protein FlgE
MDVIGNNIANINTTGFKAGRVNFQDTLNQTMSSAAGSSGSLGGTNPKQVGLGAGVASIDTIFTDGNVQATSANTDLCISKAGFFIVSDGTNSSYTRNGAFQFDANGNYGVTGSGLKVQGWMADSTGKINSTGATQDIVVKMGQSMPATATTYVNYGKNLSAASANPTITLSDGKTATYDLLDSTKSYTKGGTYNGATVTGVTGASYTLSNGTTVADTNGNLLANSFPTTTVPLTITSGSAGSYTLSDGSSVTGATSGLAVGSTYPDGTGVTFGATTNVLSNGATVTPPTGITYTNHDSFTAKIKTVASRTYTLSDGASVTDADATTAATVRANNSAYPLTITGMAQTDVSSTISAYDSQGVEHKIPVTMTKTSDNTWTVKSTGKTDTGYDVSGLNYKIVFDTAGKYSTGSTMDTATGSYKTGINAASFTTTQAGAVNMTMSFSDITQNSGSTEAQVTDQDGNAAGSLTSVSIDTAGNLIGSYDNSKTKKEGQIALAVFNNPAGLTKSGSSLYSESPNSGKVQVTTVGHGGAGNLTPSALEMSNVDLSEEFSNMIVTQRGFQSNSKIITVADEMIQTLVNMKQ